MKRYIAVVMMAVLMWTLLSPLASAIGYDPDKPPWAVHTVAKGEMASGDDSSWVDPIEGSLHVWIVPSASAPAWITGLFTRLIVVKVLDNPQETWEKHGCNSDAEAGNCESPDRREAVSGSH